MSWEITEEQKEKARIQQVIDCLDGWRYLETGEQVHPGDYVCDPRCKPVRTYGGWTMTKECHPVKTMRPKKW